MAITSRFIATNQGSSKGKIKGSFDFGAALRIGKPPYR
jgi:hypothetical protein